MSGQTRVLAILLGVLAVLVLAVGGLSAFLLLSEDDGGTASVGSGVSTGNSDDSGGGGGGGGDASAISGRLRLASGDPVTMDPHTAGDALSAEYIVEIFGGLVTILPPSDDAALDLAIVPDLAEDYPEISDDGLVYTFRLRDDARFHDGRRVTAADVKWSIERAASRELASPTALAYLGDIVGTREKFFGITDEISGVEVIDERTVQFRLREPLPPGLFLAKLTYPTAFVVDRTQVESNPRNWTRRPNGTGPYKLAEWRLGERIVLRANEAYHLGQPKLGEVLYLLSGGSALTRFENGDLDIAGITVNDVERARDPGSDLNRVYKFFPQFTISYIAFNTNVPPFDDPMVRRALALSIDRAKIAEVTFSGMLLPATGILPPQLPGYTPEDKTYPFDPEAARAALAASTYGSPENLPLITVTEVGGGAEGRIDTQAFLEQWRTELGIDVEIRQTDFATFLADQDAGRLMMFNAGWIMDYPDPEDILDLKFHSGSSLNDVNYANAEVDGLLERARTERDPEARLQLYQRAERLIVEDAAWLPLYFSQSHVVINEAVIGWFEPPMVIPRLRFIEVDR